ncbi:MAG: hypothetical protein ACI8PZ_000190 [Myxococcota bacterium]|jgi:hypothetical protein
MNTLIACVLSAVFLAAPAFAQDEEEEAEEFLLGDLGVRVDLPEHWRMTRWSDWDLKAQDDDGPILMWAWATELQTEVGEDAAAWQPVYDAMIEAEKGFDVSLEKAEIHSIKGMDAALLDFKWKVGKSKLDLDMFGATIEIGGKNMHIAAAAIPKHSERAEAARLDLVKRLEIRSPAVITPPDLVLEAEGIESPIPAGWREPQKEELGAAMKQVGLLGLENLEPCWVAIRAKPANPEPEALVTCQGGLLLGVVDEYSFEGVDAVVRQKMFGAAPVPAGELVELEDRVGFLYKPRPGLVVGVVPYDRGVARTWALGDADDPSLEAAVREVLTDSSWSGPHPASIGDQVGYYVSYRPFSPLVLGPAGLLVVLVGGAGFVGMRMMGGSKNKYDMLDDEG